MRRYIYALKIIQEQVFSANLILYRAARMVLFFYWRGQFRLCPSLTILKQMP